jgi:hypothetical protein
MKLLAWIGIGVGVVAIAIVARLYLKRRAEPIQVADDKKDDLIPAEGLLYKESVSLPPEALVAEKS